MNADVKRYVAWGGIALAGILAFASLGGNDEEERAAEYAKRFRNKTVTPLLQKADAPPVPEWNDLYRPSEFLHTLEGYKRQLETKQAEGQALYRDVQSYGGTQQSQAVIDQCQAKLQELAKGNGDMAFIRQNAEDAYQEKLQEWERLAAQPDSSASQMEELAALFQELEKNCQEAHQRKGEVERGTEAYRIYHALEMRLKRKLPFIKDCQQRLANLTKAQAEAKAALFDEEGHISHQAPKMKDIDACMAAIRALGPVEGNVGLPELLPATPQEEPRPAVFKPDLSIAATGDLAEALALPLVNQWLEEKGATPLQGSRFEWILKEGSKELEVRAPEGLQGEEEGTLRIRLTTVDDVDAAFAQLGTEGGADLILTGRKLSADATRSWLPGGKSLQTLDPETAGRAYRARICADALVFFKGAGLDMETIRSSALKETPKVFSTQDPARSEAARIFRLAPQAALDDAEEEDVLTRQQLCEKYPGKLILSVWHREAAGNVGVYEGPALRYAFGWDASTAAFRNMPQAYRPDISGCKPDRETISTGQYAYTYNIFLYRATSPASSTRDRLAQEFLTYAGDADNARLAALIRRQGFVPMDLRLDLQDVRTRLTNKDLPIKLLLKDPAFADGDFGYDAETSTWVYGLRIPIPLYYEVGEVDNKAGSAILDPDSQYYTSTQALAQIRQWMAGKRACLVVQGHADPRWGNRLDVSKESWRQNLRLSQQRAERLYSTLLRPLAPDAAPVRHAILGTSWARPACDIVLTGSLEGQEEALARCRRVDVFIVLPLSGKE